MRFNRIALINLPSPPGYVSNKDSMGGFGQLYPVGATFFPPLDLVYLATYLSEKKIPLDIFECLGLELTKEQLLEKVGSMKGDLVLAVIRTSAPTLDWDLSICSEIKTRYPKIKLGLYGPVLPHVMGRIFKENCIDYIIKNEPEDTLYDLVTGHAESEIQGLTVRQGKEWVENNDRAFDKNLDRLPFPNWRLFPYKKYTLPKSSVKSEVPFLPMLTSRGCPVGCHYCPYPVGQGLPWRFRSPKNVVDEIEYLVNDLGIQYIIFRDPMFSLNQERVIHICDEVIRRGLKFSWRCETRIDCLKKETLEAMAKAGCEGINFGVESVEVEIQSNVGRKPITEAQFTQAIALCRSLGINTFAFFIIGLPKDTSKTILKSIKFAIEMQPDWVQFTASSPFIGTKLRDWAISRGLVDEEEYAYINSHSVMTGNENLSKEQVGSLYRFAQFIQNYLINRKGMFKDHHRKNILYRSMKMLADLLSIRLALFVFGVGKIWFERVSSSGKEI